MRNTYTCCDGEEVIGRIVYGEKFPFGTVSKETYTADMAVLNGTITAVSAEVNNLRNTVETVSEMVIGGKLTEAVAKNTADITVIEGTVTNLSSSVANLNSKVSALDTAVINVKSDVMAAEGDISELKKKDENLLHAINVIEENDREQNQRISALETSNTLNSSKISEIESDISGLSTRMDGVNANVSSVSNNLSVFTAQVNSKLDGVDATISIIREDIKETDKEIDELSASVAASIAVINQRLANLEGGQALEILSFTATPDVCEMGASENVVLSWIINGNPKTITINGELYTGQGSEKTIKNVTSNTRFTLTVTSEKGISVSRSVDVNFANHIFWGLDSSAVMNEGIVKNLENTEITNERTRTFRVVPNNEYVVYAYPKRLGTSVFRSGGFDGGFNEPVTIAVDNHSGFEEDYYVYRSENKITVPIEISVI